MLLLNIHCLLTKSMANFTFWHLEKKLKKNVKIEIFYSDFRLFFVTFLRFDKFWPVIKYKYWEIWFYPCFWQKIQLSIKNQYYWVQWQPCCCGLYLQHFPELHLHSLSCTFLLLGPHRSLVRTDGTKSLQKKFNHILKAHNCKVKMSYVAQMADGPLYRKLILNILPFFLHLKFFCYFNHKPF